MNACAECSGPIREQWHGRPAVYCGDVCRKRASRRRIEAQRIEEHRVWRASYEAEQRRKFASWIAMETPCSFAVAETITRLLIEAGRVRLY